MKCCVLIVNHKLSVCSSHRNWDRKTQNEGVYTSPFQRNTAYVSPDVYAQNSIFLLFSCDERAYGTCPSH